MNGRTEGTENRADLIHAIAQWLDYGEKSLNVAHKGYFSGDGWGAVQLREHLERLKLEESSATLEPPDPNSLEATLKDLEDRGYITVTWKEAEIDAAERAHCLNKGIEELVEMSSVEEVLISLANVLYNKNRWDWTPTAQKVQEAACTAAEFRI